MESQPKLRVNDWVGVLGRYIAENSSGKFAYGVRDCCLFSAGAVKALTGVDVMADVHYSNARGAVREIRRFGGVDEAVRSVMSKAGFEEVHPLTAHRGDVVVADIPKPAAGIVSTDGWYAIFITPTGIGRVPLSHCRLAWRVG